ARDAERLATGVGGHPAAPPALHGAGGVPLVHHRLRRSRERLDADRRAGHLSPPRHLRLLAPHSGRAAWPGPPLRPLPGAPARRRALRPVPMVRSAGRGGAGMSRRGRRWGHGLLLTLAALYSLFPIYFITVQSLKTAQEDIFGHPLYVADPTFENYTELFESGGGGGRGDVIVPRGPLLLWLLYSAAGRAAPLALPLGAGGPPPAALWRARPP